MQAKKMQRVLKITNLGTTTLEKFKTHRFNFDSKQNYAIRDMLSLEEQDMFESDPKKITWDLMSDLYTYGIGRFYLGFDLPCPTSSIKQIVPMQAVGLAHDVNFSNKSYAGFGGKDLASIYDQVLDSNQFQNFLRTLYSNKQNDAKQVMLNLPNITG